jgi:hypothetical protein
MPSFAELLNKYMTDKKFNNGSLAKAINHRVDEIIELIGDNPDHPLLKRIVTARNRKKKGITSDEFVVTRATIGGWRLGQIRHPQWREVIISCGKILELPPEHLDEFLIVAGHPPIDSRRLAPPPPPGRSCITVVGKPVVQPHQFFGRTTLLGKIRWAWNKDIPEHLVVIGPRRSGKTSLLNYLKNILQADFRRPGQPQGWEGWFPRNFQLVLVDFQKEVMWKPDGFRKEVLQQLQVQTKESSELSTGEHFANVLKGQIGLKTVILMDEFNVGWERLSEDFWLNMRALGASGNVSFVLASSKNFAELVAKNHSQSSPFFNIFAHTLTLGPFTDNEARELIAHSPKQLEEVEWMLRESHCWPALLQLLCDTQLQALEMGEQNWQEEGLKRLKGEYYRHLLELPGDVVRE